MNLIFILLIAGSFSISFFITKWLIYFLSRRGIFDVPNERSSHATPVPRGGGIAMIFGFLLSLGLIRWFVPNIPIPGLFFFVSVSILVVIGFLDDKFTISPITRFSVHLLAVGLVLFETGGLQVFPLPEPFSFPLSWLSIPLTLLWVLAVMNIYNFLDGIDGFAGTQAFIAGVAVAVLDWGGVGMLTGGAVAFASLGFLVWNWHPAKIFMGDVGSVTLGFIFAVLPLYITFHEIHIANFAIIIFLWFFLSDGAFTILGRLVRGKKVWEAHREHLYQKWVIKGRRHDHVTQEVMIYGLFLILGFFIIYYLWPNLLALSFLLALILYLFYWYRVRNYKV